VALCSHCNKAPITEEAYASIDDAHYRTYRLCANCVKSHLVSELALRIEPVVVEGEPALAAVATMENRVLALDRSGALYDTILATDEADEVLRRSDGAGSALPDLGCEHVFSGEGKAIVCKVCLQCTAQGAGCYRASRKDRVAGEVCGCGTVDAGCSKCGICRACAAAPDKVLQALAATLKGGSAAATSTSPAAANATPGPVLRRVKAPWTGDEKGVVEFACGAKHALLRTGSGAVFVTGGNERGQLGLGADLLSSSPYQQLPLLGPAKALAVGAHHSLVLLENGKVLSFGDNRNGQLGRKLHSEDCQEALPAHEPGEVDLPYEAVQVAAQGDRSFFWYGEVVADDSVINLASAVCTSDAVILGFPRGDGGETSTSTLAFNLATGFQSWSAEQNVSNSGAAPSFAFNPSSCCLYVLDPPAKMVEVHMPLAADRLATYPALTSVPESYHRKDALLLTPTVALLQVPMRPSAVGLALVSGLRSLAAGPVGVERTSQPTAAPKSLALDDLTHCLRFKSQGGGWGYGGGSPDAIAFQTDTEVVIGGFGLYGSVGNSFKADFAFFQEDNVASPLAQMKFTYSMTGQEGVPYYPFLLDEPVVAEAGVRYVIRVTMQSQNSSACGSSGQATVTIDGVTFTFSATQHSNNGTDVGSGQFPAILFTTDLKPPSGIATVSPPAIFWVGEGGKGREGEGGFAHPLGGSRCDCSGRGCRTVHVPKTAGKRRCGRGGYRAAAGVHSRTSPRDHHGHACGHAGVGLDNAESRVGRHRHCGR
jgi:E3 ubiquitin-protein ligase MYCBP2